MRSPQAANRPRSRHHPGMPSRDILKHITALAGQAARIAIAPDSDLDGTRITTAAPEPPPPSFARGDAASQRDVSKTTHNPTEARYPRLRL